MIYIEVIILLIILIIVYTNSLQLNNNKKLCVNCKWFIPNNNPNMKEYGLCKIYKNVLSDKTGEKIIYDYAEHCRINEDMCGKTGYLFEPLNSRELNFLNEKIKILQDRYDELTERFSVEIVEKKEIEEIDEEMYIVAQEIEDLQHRYDDIYNLIKDLQHHYDYKFQNYDDLNIILQEIKEALNKYLA